MVGIAITFADATPTAPELEGPPFKAPEGKPAWLLERRAWCLQPQPGKIVDEATRREFWLNHPDALKDIQARAIPTEQAIPEIIAYLANWSRRHRISKYVCMPTSFDWGWFRGLVLQFGNASQQQIWRSTSIGHKATCLSTIFTIAQELYGIKQDAIGECREFTDSHKADEDAARQAWLYLRVMYLMKGVANGELDKKGQPLQPCKLLENSEADSG